MSKYPTVKLGDVCDILNGFAFKSENYVKSGLRIIRISNVQKGYLEDKDPKFYPIDSIKSFNNFILKSEDILISLTGNVGRVAIIKDSFLPAVLNQRVACLRPNSGVLNPKYLFQILNSDFFEKNCINNAKGIAQKNMSTEWLKLYKIPLPNLQIQNEISTNILKITENIEKRKQQLIKLDMLAKSRFIEMFGDFPLNEKKWETGQIRNVVYDVRYGTSLPASLDGKYPYFRMNNITYSGELDLSEIKRINIPDREFSKYAIQKGDVLFNRTNSKELVGKTCVYDKDDKMILAGFIIRIRVNDRMLPEFLSAFLNADFSKKMLLEKCKTAIGQANINAQELQNFDIYIPPIELQKQFVFIKNQLDKSKFRIKKSLEKLEMTYKALLQEYFG